MLKRALFALIALQLLAGCAGPPLFAPAATPTPKPPFTITAEPFAASPFCDGTGTVDNTMQDGKLVGTAQDNVKATLIDKSGMPGPWCSGFQHRWIGKGEFEGYTFDSDLADPLVFVVDRQKGYYYLSGKGTITLPDGQKVTLPAGN